MRLRSASRSAFVFSTFSFICAALFCSQRAPATTPTKPVAYCRDGEGGRTFFPETALYFAPLPSPRCRNCAPQPSSASQSVQARLACSTTRPQRIASRKAEVRGTNLRQLHRPLVFPGLALLLVLLVLALALFLLAAAALFHLQAFVLPLAPPPPPPRIAVLTLVAAPAPPLGGPQSALASRSSPAAVALT